MAKHKKKAHKPNKEPQAKKEVKPAKRAPKDFLKTLDLEGFVDQKVVRVIIPILFILIVMWFAMSIRVGSVNLDGLDDRLRGNVHEQIRDLIDNDLNQQYPDLNAAYKAELAEEIFNEAIKTGHYDSNGQRVDINQLIASNSESIKSSFKFDNGQTYLTAIDPYHFFRLSELYSQNGYVGDELRVDENGKEVPYLSYKLAPNGAKGLEKAPFHVWLEAMMFKLNGVDENSTMGEKVKTIFLLPVIIVVLSVIPVYFVIREFSNDFFALFGSLLMVSIGTFVSRTVAGFVDTDAYNVLFPLLVIASLVYGLTLKQRHYKYGFIALAGFFQGMFLWAWEAGWFIFVFALLAMIGFDAFRFIAKLIGDHTKVKDHFQFITEPLLLTLTYIVSSFIFVFVFTSKNIFSIVQSGLLGSVSGIAGISASSIWPNVFSSVAELNPASFPAVINSVGGELIFIIALLGLLLLSLDFKVVHEQFKLYNRILAIAGFLIFLAVIKGGYFVSLTANSPFLFLMILFLPVGLGLLFSLYNENTNVRVFLVILLSIWMSGTIYMSLNGVRFILLLGPAFAIAFGLGLFYLARIINSFAAKEFELKGTIKSNALGIVAMFILFWVLFNPVANAAGSLGNNALPNFDDQWYNTMIKVKENSAEDAIITSWWDFGHFFTAVAQRGVTFDGGSQTTPQSHWVGKLLMEGDEDVSHDILRMIVCGGNNAFDTIMEISSDNTGGVKTNKLIYATFGQTREQKIETLRNYEYYQFTEEEIDQIMQELACENPRENFLVTSQDMVGKAPVWAHWGSWDFTRKYVHDNYKKMSVQEISAELDENETLIQNYVSQLEAIDVQSSSQGIKREDLVNQWFAPYPGYIPIQGNFMHPCVEDATHFSCLGGGVIIDKFNGTIQQNLGIQEKFRVLVFPGEDNTVLTFPVDQSGTIDLVLIPTVHGPRLMLAQAPLGEALFTKLFYLGGIGVTKFENFDDVQSVTGVRVITWKVKWDEVETSSE